MLIYMPTPLLCYAPQSKSIPQIGRHRPFVSFPRTLEPVDLLFRCRSFAGRLKVWGRFLMDSIDCGGVQVTIWTSFAPCCQE